MSLKRLAPWDSQIFAIGLISSETALLCAGLIHEIKDFFKNLNFLQFFGVSRVYLLRS